MESLWFMITTTVLLSIITLQGFCNFAVVVTIFNQEDEQPREMTPEAQRMYS